MIHPQHTSFSESPVLIKHQFVKPGIYNVTVRVRNPVTEAISMSKEIAVENPVRRNDFHTETELIDHQNGSAY